MALSAWAREHVKYHGLDFITNQAQMNVFHLLCEETYSHSVLLGIYNAYSAVREPRVYTMGEWLQTSLNLNERTAVQAFSG